MKRTLIAVCSLLVAVGAFAQGTVNFNNRVPASGVNAVVTLDDGVTKATGPQYVAQLLAGGTAATMAPVGTPSPFKTGALAGYVAGGAVTIPGIPAGGGASIQMIAWDSTKYADITAALAGTGGVGKSGVVTLAKTGDPTASPPGLPADLVGLSAFSITGGSPVIPEPSTLALAVAGGFGLLLFRRRK